MCQLEPCGLKYQNVKPKYFQTVQKGARTYEELSNKGQLRAVLNMSSVFLKDIQSGTYGFRN